MDPRIEIANKIRRNLESSQNISLLQEYCQKTQKPLPEYFPVQNNSPNNPVFGMVLLVAGQRFEASGATNLKDAKKACNHL